MASRIRNTLTPARARLAVKSFSPLVSSPGIENPTVVRASAVWVTASTMPNPNSR